MSDGPFGISPAIYAVPNVIVVSAWLGEILYDHRDAINVATQTEWLLIPALMLAGGLFWFRGIFPLSYGLLELVVGMTAISVAAHATELTSRIVSLLSGIYIVIRGLDNVEKGLGSAKKAYWLKLFPKRA